MAMISSWNEQITDEKWVNELYENDPRAFQSEYYMIGGASLRDDVTCMSKNECHLGINVGKGEDGEMVNEAGRTVVGPVSFSWVFCFSCNRIFHLACQGHRSSEFMQMKLIAPFKCNDCENDPLNDCAKEFYNKRDEIDLSMKKRREYFTKSFVDLSKSVEKEDHEDSHSEGSQEEENDELKIMSEKCRKIEKEKNELMDELKKCYETLQDYSKLKAEVLTLRQKLFEAKHDRCMPVTSHDTHKLKFSSSTLFSPQHVSNVSDDLMRDPPNFVTNRKPGPVPKRKSLIENIDLDNLSRGELITLEQAQAQIEATEAQREIAFTQNLTAIRKALPRITKFNGDPKKWIQFKRDVERHRTVGRYEDYEMRILVLQALEGLALSRVEGMIDKIPCDDTMKALQKCFGDPMRIIDKCAKDILAIKVPREIFKDDVLRITSKFQEYKAACQYAEVEVQNSNQLASHVFDQLNVMQKIMFRHRYRLDHDGAECRVIDLDNLYIFLENLAEDLEDKRIEEKILDDKKKGIQLHSTAYNQRSDLKSSYNSSSKSFNVVRRPDDYMYEIKDKNESPLGYDLKELARMNKFCECCSSASHFTVQCYKYKAMNASEKLQFVNEKNICRNCVVSSTHRSFSCSLKDRCGFRESSNTCALKHHITLHKALTDNNSKSLKFNNSNNSNGGSSNGSNKSFRSQKPFRRKNANFNQRKAEAIAKANDEQQDGLDPVHLNSSSDLVDVLISQAPTVDAIHESIAIDQANVINTANTASSCSNSNDSQVLKSQTFLVHALSSKDLNRTVKVFKNYFLGPRGYVIHYSLGDSAAEATLVKDELREILGIEGEACEIVLQWTDGSLKSVDAIKIDITVKGLASYCKEIVLKNCYAVPDLYLPRRSLNIDHFKEKFPYLRDIDYEGYDNISPSMLIGSPHASVFESMDVLIEGGVGNPVGVRAKLGWTVYGGCSDKCCDLPKNIDSLTLVEKEINDDEHPVSNERLYELVAYNCSIDSLGIATKSVHITELEQKAIDLLSKEMVKLDNGSIEVPLIWNCTDNIIPKLPNNYSMVVKRQLAHERVLAKDPVHLKAFNDNFMKLLSEGYVRPANSYDLYNDWPNVSYIPMSLVKNSNKDPPKFRNVFDASARFHGVSLNDNLLKGPDLLVDILKPLLKLRENEVAIVADVEAMYMRVKIALRDQQVQRVLWRPNTNEEFKIFIFTSMLFGPSSSPFTSQFVKNAVANDWKEKYPDAASTIIELMYMDDLLTSETSVPKAIAIAKQCIEILDSINWKLGAFQSNSVELLKSLPVPHASQDNIPLLESEHESCVTKVLGCVWDVKSDSFVFKFDKNLFIKIVKDCNYRPTKRDQ